MKVALCSCGGKYRELVELAESFDNVVVFDEMCESETEEFFDVVCCSHPNLRGAGRMQIDLPKLGIEKERAELTLKAYEILLKSEREYFKLRVGESLLIKTDSVELARKLQKFFRPLYVLTSNREMLGVGIPIEGEIVAVKGEIGSFKVILNGVNLHTGEKVSEIVVDQLVVPGFELEKDGLFNSEMGIFEAILNVGELIKVKAIEYDESLCVICGMCDCVHGCLERENRVVLNLKSCLNCGRCSSLCPTGALSFSLMPEDAIGKMVDVMSAYKDMKVLLYVCERVLGKVYSSSSGKIFPIIVPCVNALSEVEVLYPLLKGFNGVYVLHCDDCRHGSFERVKVAKKICEALGVRNLVINDEFNRDIVEDLAELKPLDENFDAGGNTKREKLFEIVKRMLEVRKAEIEKLPVEGFGKVRVSEECTLCKTCENVCLTKALKKEEGKLKFIHGLCVDCKLCEKLCPERAISVEEILDLSEFSIERVVKADDMIACPRCGKRHISKREYEKISRLTGQRYSLMFCAECRAIVVFEGIYREVFGGRLNEPQRNS